MFSGLKLTKKYREAMLDVTLGFYQGFILEVIYTFRKEIKAMN